MNRLHEAFENRKFAQGQVKLPNAKLADPHIQTAIQTMLKAGLTKGQLEKVAQRDPFLAALEALIKQAGITGVNIPTDTTPATYQDIVDMIAEKETKMQE